MSSPLYEIGFSTLDKEIQLDDLPLRGNFPNWLNGMLVRTGPAKFEVGEHRYKHWFDGLAMLHKFSFSGGRLSYANRFIEGKSYTEARKEGKISRGEFGTDPCRSLFARVASLFFPRLPDNANINISKLAGKCEERHIFLTGSRRRVFRRAGQSGGPASHSVGLSRPVLRRLICEYRYGSHLA
jgi:beta,beta-carotene 9',10'-dioxygenase